MVYLFKYDSVHGVYPGEVTKQGNNLLIDGNVVQVFSERDPTAIPWGASDA